MPSIGQQPRPSSGLDEDLRSLVEMAKDISRESQKLSLESRMRREEAAELRRQIALVRTEADVLRRRIAETWHVLNSVDVDNAGHRGRCDDAEAPVIVGPRGAPGPGALTADGTARGRHSVASGDSLVVGLARRGE
jgi:hypothetical protein